VCPSGLLTFIPLTAPDLSKIQVFPNKKDGPLPKKSKNNYYVSHKCKEIATQFPWAEMLKSDLGDTNCVKCIVCLTVKGKDVILGLKSNMFKKHMGKTKVV